MLSIAFHPGYEKNRRFYVYYTDKFGNIAIDSVKASAGNPNVADNQSLSRIMRRSCIASSRLASLAKVAATGASRVFTDSPRLF